MAVAIVDATQTGNGDLTLEVCPCYADGACTCPRDETGTLDPPHPVFTYGRDPDPAAKRDPADYAALCAQEALLLVTVAATQREPAAGAKALAHLVGMALTEEGGMTGLQQAAQTPQSAIAAEEVLG